MSDKYQGRYRIPSARLAAWDYGNNAAYFITICTHDHAHFFGEVANDEMQLNPLGQAALDCWNAIPQHYPFVLADGFVVMPNHVHGIVIIDKPSSCQPSDIQNRFGPQSRNLGAIVRGFKIGVTQFARQHQMIFGWQDRYHDHIIRNEAEYQRINDYISTNPTNWRKDTFYAGSTS